MMKARFLKAAQIEELYNNVNDNLELYRSGDFSYLNTDPGVYFEGSFDVDLEELSKIKVEEGDLREVENCKIIYAAINGISPYVGRDERFWVYLTHTSLLEYTRTRWPIPEDDEKAVKYIRNHFFARTKRAVERENSASRLWWMAYLCSRVNHIPFEELLECLLYKSDVRANIIERPTVSQSLKVFSAIVSKLYESYKGDKGLFERENFRKFMKELNLQGGVKLLDALDESEIHVIVDLCT